MLKKPTVVRQRCENLAAITIPSLLPPEGCNETQELTYPQQSHLARCINNLAGKLLLSLFPPQGMFFRYDLDAQVMKRFTPDSKAAIEKQLAERASDVHAYIRNRGFGSVLFEAMRHYLVTGNLVLRVAGNGNLILYPISHFALQRDSIGNLLALEIYEKIGYRMLSEEQQALLIGQNFTQDQEVPLTTVVIREHAAYRWHQELGGVMLPGTEGSSPVNKLPFIVPASTVNRGDSYGRSFCEELFGDIRTFEALSGNLSDFAAAASFLLFLVRPGGLTDPEDLRRAKPLSFVEGQQEDIATLLVDKVRDFQVAAGHYDKLERSISSSFLLTNSIQRQGERVTAEEISRLAQDLETGLGGMYTRLAANLQVPLVIQCEELMVQEGLLAPLPEDSGVSVKTVGGYEALGQGHDLSRLDAVAQRLAAVQGLNYVNMGEHVRRVVMASGVELDGYLKTDEEVAAEMQTAQLNQVAADAAPQLLKQ